VPDRPLGAGSPRGRSAASAQRDRGGLSAQRAGDDLRWDFNPEQRSTWVLIPGIGGVIMMIAMLLLGAQSIVREREEGAWEALPLSRVSGVELLL
jgi:hypothetical protein